MKQLIFLCLLLPTVLCAQINGYTPPPKTGNVSVDDANHTKAKTEWIKNNPEAYRAAGGNPDEVLKVNQPEPVKEQRTLPAFAAQKSYTLVDVRAVAAEGWQVSESELTKETELMQAKYPYQVSKIEFGQNGTLRWLPNAETDLRGKEIKMQNNTINWIFDKRCETCNDKTFYLQLLNNQNNSLRYNLQSDDAGSKFAYQFTYQLIP